MRIFGVAKDRRSGRGKRWRGNCALLFAHIFLDAHIFFCVFGEVDLVVSAHSVWIVNTKFANVVSFHKEIKRLILRVMERVELCHFSGFLRQGLFLTKEPTTFVNEDCAVAIGGVVWGIRKKKVDAVIHDCSGHRFALPGGCLKEERGSGPLSSWLVYLRAFACKQRLLVVLWLASLLASSFFGGSLIDALLLEAFKDLLGCDQEVFGLRSFHNLGDFMIEVFLVASKGLFGDVLKVFVCGSCRFFSHCFTLPCCFFFLFPALQSCTK